MFTLYLYKYRKYILHIKIYKYTYKYIKYIVYEEIYKTHILIYI